MAISSSVVFFGATNELSRAAFEWLAASEVRILAVIVSARAAGVTEVAGLEQWSPPSPPGELPLLTPYHQPTLMHSAWAAGVALFAVDRVGRRAVAELLDHLGPAAACVACYPQRIPPVLLSRPPFGFLNVHPSLLPFYRGPDPLFWLFQRADEKHRGVTVHQMDEGLDTGPILLQEPIAFPDGLSRAEVERRSGELGGRLLVRAIRALSDGAAPHPQTDEGSYHRWPEEEDYRLDTTWSAQRAFNFMQATHAPAAAYPVRVVGQEILLTEALAVDPSGSLAQGLEVAGLVARVQFSPGVLSARVMARP